MKQTNIKEKQQAIASAINGDSSQLRKMIKQNYPLIIVGERHQDKITFSWGYGINRQEVTMRYAEYKKQNPFPGVPLIIVQQIPEHETEN